jgi:hypothetical protein
VWHGVVVLINLALAYFLLIGLQAAHETTLRVSFLHVPDLTGMLVIISGFALTWCVIRTLLVVRSYRAFGRPAVSAKSIGCSAVEK